ncbi:MAG: glycosyltransferase family 39 protein [Terriglobales bacterium]
MRLGQAAWKLVQSPVVVFAIALTTRLWALSQLLPDKAWQFFYQYNEFAHIASAVASGHGYSSPWANTPLAPTAVEPPVYAYLLAGIFRLAGVYSYASLWIAVGLNALLSATTAVLILRFGSRMFGPSAGVLAAWLWSCWLYEAAVAVRLWESSLSALLLMIGLLLLPELDTSLRVSRWLRFGVLAGVSALTNTSLLSVFPFFWLWLWISHRRRKQSCNRQLLASVGVFLIMLVPWTIRNYVTFGRLIPVRDNFGLELWLGNHEGVTHVFDNDFPILNPAEYNRLGEIRFMEAKRQIALQFIAHHPGEFLRLSMWRCFRYWTAPDASLWLPISLLAWAGMLLLLWRKRWDAVPYAIVLVFFPLIYYVTHTFNSYRHPTEPVMFLLASYAAVCALKAVSVGRTLLSADL